MNITFEQLVALRSAVDLLTGAYTPEYAEEVLGAYKFGEARGDLGQSLYKVLDRIQHQMFEQNNESM
jgi:hypothetical protein